MARKTLTPDAKQFKNLSDKKVERRTQQIVCNELRELLYPNPKDYTGIDDETGEEYLLDLVITVQGLNGYELAQYKSYFTNQRNKLYEMLLESLRINDPEATKDSVTKMMGLSADDSFQSAEILAKKYLVGLGLVEPKLDSVAVLRVFEKHPGVFERLYMAISALSEMGYRAKKKP